jgi:predicted nucleic acid-binding Zn ribbon protein
VVGIEGQGTRRAAKKRRGRREGDPTRISVSLPEAARLLGADGAVELAVLRRNWAHLAGPQVAAHAHPTSLAHGVLTVTTDHHAWAAELRLLSGELLQCLQVSCPAVRAIAVQVSPREGLRW